MLLRLSRKGGSAGGTGTAGRHVKLWVGVMERTDPAVVLHC